jgi:hypothetical protein
MFDDRLTGTRILDFWPATGTWITATQQGKMCDPYEIVMIAKSELARRGSSAEAALAND